MPAQNLKNRKKAIVIVGTTASGKTALAVDLACKFDGEVISADSRQVYKHMDIGTGKDLDEYEVRSKKLEVESNVSEDCFSLSVNHIPYHLIDVVHPNTPYDLAKWLNGAKLALKDICERNKLPVIAGGTGLYVQALVDDFNLSLHGENVELRQELEKKTKEELFAELLELDEKFASKLNNSEKNNKRRLIRYIEIKKQGEIIKNNDLKKNSEYEYLIIGIAWPKDIIKERIHKRLIDRLEKEDMIGEVVKLHQEEKASWKRLESFGLEYKFIARFLQKKLGYDEMVEKLDIASRQYAKRQMTWLKRWEKQGTTINWINNKKEAEEKVKEFLELDNI